MLSAIMVFMLFMLQACSTDPEPIKWDSDQCEHCRMTIADNKFGAEIINKKGKTYKFDATECMLHFVKAGKIQESEIAVYVVIDASLPGNLINADKSVYLISENFPSPMGANISAFGSKGSAEQFQKQYGGEIKTWDDLLKKFMIR